MDTPGWVGGGWAPIKPWGWGCGWLVVFAMMQGLPVGAQPFLLPTANPAILHPGSEEKYFVGTVGRPWTSGRFGCVRSGGTQFHEGIDIRAMKRDDRGEATDPVRATAAGTVVHVSRNPALSNYGRYLILRHEVEGLEVYSLYAHLREIRGDLRPGKGVGRAEAIGVLGRSSNTREGISKDRAHLHFELNLRVSDRFTVWRKARFPDLRNDHGEWNGQNLLGLDPERVFREERARGPDFSLLRMLRSEPELCRVQVRARDFSWLRRYRPLVEPVVGRAPVVGYELVLNATGIPLRAIPRSEAEMKGRGRFHLVSVNAAEQRLRPCRKLVIQRGGVWQLGGNAERLLDLLTY